MDVLTDEVRLRRQLRATGGIGDFGFRAVRSLLLMLAVVLASAPTRAATPEKQAARAATAPAHARASSQSSSQPQASPQPGSVSPATTDLAPGYFITPGDVLKILVWKEPELTTEAFVRLDGRITVPLLGDVMAAGRTPDDLASEIQSRLARFLEVPQVTLAVSQAISARFYVLGEVVRPGAFPLPSRVSIVQALALAGGFREFAKKDAIRILRQEGAVQAAIPFNYKEVELGINLKQNIFLEAGDTILVP